MCVYTETTNKQQKHIVSLPFLFLSIFITLNCIKYLDNKISEIKEVLYKHR